MFSEIMILVGLLFLGGGFFLYQKGKKDEGYVRMHTREDVKQARGKMEEVKEEEREGYTNLFSNVFGSQSEDKIEKKVRKLEEKKKKKWQTMGFFGG